MFEVAKWFKTYRGQSYMVHFPDFVKRAVRCRTPVKKPRSSFTDFFEQKSLSPWD